MGKSPGVVGPGREATLLSRCVQGIMMQLFYSIMPVKDERCEKRHERFDGKLIAGKEKLRI